MDILRASGRNLSRTAIVLENNTYTYRQLLHNADNVRAGITAVQNKQGAIKFGPRVGIYAAPGPEYVSSTWGSWLAGGIAVPLATSHPARELDYVIKDAGIASILVPEEHFDKVKDVAHENQVDLRVLEASSFAASGSSSSSLEGQASEWSEERIATELAGASGYNGGALIMYTSGTTGKPKGVLHTHRSVMAQVRSLTEAWRWAPQDRILHALPLHHTHGIINALYCALHTGAAVEFLPRFSPARVWSRLQSGDVSVFMGVPTMYALLLAAYDSMSSDAQAASRAAAAKLRLTISGSAACPLPIMNRWAQLSGRPLLERYGMTETGMIASNPYQGDRRAGTVGVPLPGVEVRLAADADASNGNQDAPVGEIRVRGDALFREYWGRAEATAEAFDEGGWFRTGDTGTLEGAPAYYRILGRTSVDIIKSGGYKISALHIESVLLEHPQVLECAVLGVPDDTYGEVVAALVAPKKAAEGQAATALDTVELRKFCGQSLPPYQVPRVVLEVEGLPRNAMGKINKKQLLASYLDQLTASRK